MELLFYSIDVEDLFGWHYLSWDLKKVRVVPCGHPGQEHSRLVPGTGSVRALSGSPLGTELRETRKMIGGDADKVAMSESCGALQAVWNLVSFQGDGKPLEVSSRAVTWLMF